MMLRVWKSTPIAALFLALLLLNLGATGCGESGPMRAEIVAFEPPKGIIQAGDPATTSVRVENTGPEDGTLWIGYSVQDPTGRWHDGSAIPVELAAGEESGPQELSTEALDTPGYYKPRVSVWSGEPGSDPEAKRLANAEEASTFRVSGTREDFASTELDPARWKATTRELGRSNLEPENVSIDDSQLRLTLPAETLDGGEIESKGPFGPGFYAARIKVPDAPSSITGFFLYEPPDFESEIDVEIYNDSSRRVQFTTYADGKQTHTETTKLPFDPTQDFHDYAFSYDEDSITFLVDGEPIKELEGGLPDKPMKLYVNAWFPQWLSGEEPDSDRYVYVDWIGHQ
jgi:beta-glucanase (GH16 family)